jgi:hypothetical protein
VTQRVTPCIVLSGTQLTAITHEVWCGAPGPPAALIKPAFADAPAQIHGMFPIFCCLQYDEYDNAAHCMIAHSPVAWEHVTFKDVVIKVSNVDVYYKGIRFYLQVCMVASGCLYKRHLRMFGCLVACALLRVGNLMCTSRASGITCRLLLGVRMSCGMQKTCCCHALRSRCVLEGR